MLKFEESINVNSYLLYLSIDLAQFCLFCWRYQTAILESFDDYLREYVYDRNSTLFQNVLLRDRS